jgi:hypothetical protein
MGIGQRKSEENGEKINTEDTEKDWSARRRRGAGALKAVREKPLKPQMNTDKH